MEIHILFTIEYKVIWIFVQNREYSGILINKNVNFAKTLAKM